jgi:hypothetical protein
MGLLVQLGLGARSVQAGLPVLEETIRSGQSVPSELSRSGRWAQYSLGSRSGRSGLELFLPVPVGQALRSARALQRGRWGPWGQRAKRR